MFAFPGYDQLGLLAAWAAGMLATYAGKAGEKAVTELADGAAKGIAKQLCSKATEAWHWVKGKLGGKPFADGELAKFEEAPAGRKDALAMLLEQRLMDDKDGAFLKELRPLLDSLREMQDRMPKGATQANVQVGSATQGGTLVQQAGNGNQSQITG